MHIYLNSISVPGWPRYAAREIKLTCSHVPKIWGNALDGKKTLTRPYLAALSTKYPSFRDAELAWYCSLIESMVYVLITASGSDGDGIGPIKSHTSLGSSIFVPPVNDAFRPKLFR